jgi:hypothetical protein
VRFGLLIFCALGLAQGDWTPTAGIFGPNVLGLFLQGDTLFAGTVAGLYRSPDSGQNWTAINEGLDARAA